MTNNQITLEDNIVREEGPSHVSLLDSSRLHGGTLSGGDWMYFYCSKYDGSDQVPVNLLHGNFK